MKLSLFTDYGATNSTTVFDAFSEAAKNMGFSVVFNTFDADVYVIWSVLWHGRMAENKTVWKYAKEHHKHVIVLEVGGLVRNKTFKVGLGGINNLAEFANKENLIAGRSQQLGLRLKPWTDTGEHILICGQHTKSEQWMHRGDPVSWLQFLVKQIRALSKRTIIFRPHPRDRAWSIGLHLHHAKIHVPCKLPNTYDDYDFDTDLNMAWAVVSPSSNPGLQSIINGVPAFVDEDSLALPVANQSIINIENPNRPSRDLWFEQLCHTEWTVEEIAAGVPLIRLINKINT